MEEREYLGYKEVKISDDDVQGLFNGSSSENKYGLLRNEYMIANDDHGDRMDVFVSRDGDTIERVPFKTINSRYMGVIRGRNTQQRMALDMLYSPDVTIKIVAGKFGSGKTYLMISSAIDMIERGIFDKIVYVRNNIEVKNSKPIGHLPGSYEEKMLPYAMPIADALGGIDGLEMMIHQNKIEIVHLGFIRGRDFKHSLIICSEAENLTKEHVQLLIGRVGEGSELWIDGDFKQVDAQVFEENNGLMIAVDKLKGHKRFGYVKLQKTERSETAAMADLLD